MNELLSPDALRAKVREELGFSDDQLATTPLSEVFDSLSLLELFLLVEELSEGELEETAFIDVTSFTDVYRVYTAAHTAAHAKS